MLGRHLPRRKLSAEEKAAATVQRASSLLQEIRHWLLAMEEFHNLQHAAMRGFSTTKCSGGGGNHWWHIRLLPQRVGANRVACTAPRDRYPDNVLQAHVLEPLRQEGFRIANIDQPPCGCTTFTVYPRRLAGR